VPTSPLRPVRFGLVGRGWRADFFLRLAHQLPGHFVCAGVVTRDPEAGAALERQWGVPTFRDVGALVAATSPELLVTSVSAAANAAVLRSAVAEGLPVLAETPPATTVDELRALWADVGGSGLVQVAEQHPFLPAVVALRGLLQRGVLGEVSAAQVSWTHGYHATALLRCLLGIGGEPVTVQAVRTTAPLLEGPDRDGRPASPQPRATATPPRCCPPAAGSGATTSPTASGSTRCAAARGGARQPRRGGRDLRALVRRGRRPAHRRGRAGGRPAWTATSRAPTWTP
jgi:hypothetical protein